MKAVRGILTSIAAYFDGAVMKLENHEAVVGKTIQEIERAKLQVKQHLRSVQKQLAELEEKQRVCMEEQNAWRRRAKELKERDRERALECLKRAAHDEERLKALEEQYVVNGERRDRAEADITRLGKLLEEVKHRRSEMRARASGNAARRTSDGAFAGTAESIEEIFSRWELHVGDESYEAAPPVDSFKRQFEEEEERERFERELAAL